MKFWDASALVLLCCAQPATAQAERLARDDGTMVVWWATPWDPHHGRGDVDPSRRSSRRSTVRSRWRSHARRRRSGAGGRARGASGQRRAGAGRAQV